MVSQISHGKCSVIEIQILNTNNIEQHSQVPGSIECLSTNYQTIFVVYHGHRYCNMIEIYFYFVFNMFSLLNN